jgi:calcineurin-like phosphoesterase family protein
MQLNLDTWIISDSHFFHENIIKFTNRTEWSLPSFIDYWMNNIQDEDVVFHLGDIFMGKGSIQKAKTFIQTLPGQKYFLRGNHDKQPTEFYAHRGWTEIGKDSRLYWQGWKGKRVLFSHYPDTRDLDWTINIHGHIHSGGYAPGVPLLDYRNVSLEAVWRPVRLREVLEGDMYQPRSEAAIWPLSKVYEMQRSGRLDEHLCEIERFH